MEGKLYGKIIYQSPGRYVQGKGVIESIADETQRLGSHALIISDEVVWNITKDQMIKVFQIIQKLIMITKHLKANLQKMKLIVSLMKLRQKA